MIVLATGLKFVDCRRIGSRDRSTTGACRNVRLPGKESRMIQGRTTCAR
jgi:hypothetical protein